MKRFVKQAFDAIPLLRDWLRTRGTAGPIDLPGLIRHRLRQHGRRPYWPVHPTSLISGCEYILTGIGTAPGLSPGCLICAGPTGITIGDYSIVAPNVGIIGVNHDPANLNVYVAKPISIGRYCWIGMNAVILPGVTLGDHTVVGAGAVVTRSFPEGYGILAGNPARVLRRLEPGTMHEPRNEHEYVGYIPVADFPAFRRRHLRM